MATNPLIRPVLIRDYDLVLNLDSMVYQDPWSLSDLDKMRKSREHGLSVVIYDGKLCGYAAHQKVNWSYPTTEPKPHLSLNKICIQPELRRKRLATQLIEPLQHMVKKGRFYSVFTVINSDNHPAIRFLQDNLFRVVEELNGPITAYRFMYSTYEKNRQMPKNRIRQNLKNLEL